VRYEFAANDIKMLRAFIDESVESLQKAKDEALYLETAINPSTSLENIVGQVHTLKGLSSFFSLTEITRLSYQMESVLAAMRNGNVQSGEEAIELLMKAGNALGEMITQLSEACDGVAQGKELEVELCCTHDLNGLIEAMQLLLQEHQELDSPSPDQQPGQSLTQPEGQKQMGVQSVLAKKGEGQSDVETVPFLLTGAAVGLMEDFLLEVEEHSGIITEQLLIKLDSNPKDAESFGDLFRRVHTLKGNTGLLMSVPIDEVLRSFLQKVLQIFQDMESILAKLRDAKTPISSAIINLCFEVMDAIMRITSMLHKGVVADDGTLENLATAMVDIQACELDDLPCQTIAVEAIAKPANAQKAAKNTETSSSGHSIRVSGEKIDRLMNVIGELSISKNVFSQIARKLTMEHNLPQLSREVKDAGQFVNRISAELENAIMAMRMTEVRTAFQKYPRILRDIALQTGKKILLIMEGEDTELDKNIIEQIGDPLLQLVRNSGDHGIEPEEERRAAGKDPQGNVWLRAYNRGNYVIIEVEDDGRGMNSDKLRQKAVEKGFITQQEALQMSDEQTLQLIFLPGFSMAKSVTEISGRGVGMDVVRSNITALQGSIKINSQLGKGSKITMQLPLTLLVSRGLVVEVQQLSFVIPLDNVLETAKVSADKLVTRRGRRILYHRGEVLGVVSLAEILKMPISELSDYTPVVILTDGQTKVGMIVDRLLNEQDILVKPLPEYLSGISGMGGATIMGDGKVALVLNPVELMQLVTR